MAKCTDTSQCEDGTEYCDVNMNRCTTCADVCNPKKGLKDQCQLFCPKYIIDVKSNTEATTAQPERLYDKKVTTSYTNTLGHQINQNVALQVLTSILVIMVIIAMVMVLIALYKRLDESHHFQCFGYLFKKQGSNIYGHSSLKRSNSTDETRYSSDLKRYSVGDNARLKITDETESELNQSDQQNTNESSNTRSACQENGTDNRIKNETAKQTTLNVNKTIGVESPIQATSKEATGKGQPTSYSSISNSKQTNASDNLSCARNNSSTPNNTDNSLEDALNAAPNKDIPQVNDRDVEMQRSSSNSVREVAISTDDSLRLDITEYFSCTQKYDESNNDGSIDKPVYKETKVSDLKDVNDNIITNNALHVKPTSTENDVKAALMSFNKRVYEPDKEENDDTSLKQSIHTVSRTNNANDGAISLNKQYKNAANNVLHTNNTNPNNMALVSPIQGKTNILTDKLPIQELQGNIPCFNKNGYMALPDQDRDTQILKFKDDIDIRANDGGSSDTAYVSATPAHVQPEHPGHSRPRKRIYDILKAIDWVQGYYSEGSSITVYTDLNYVKHDVAFKELTCRTGETKEMFHLEHESEIM